MSNKIELKVDLYKVGVCLRVRTTHYDPINHISTPDIEDLKITSHTIRYDGNNTVRIMYYAKRAVWKHENKYDPGYSFTSVDIIEDVTHLYTGDSK